jgi:hypothetical protein
MMRAGWSSVAAVCTQPRTQGMVGRICWTFALVSVVTLVPPSVVRSVSRCWWCGCGRPLLLVPFGGRCLYGGL